MAIRIRQDMDKRYEILSKSVKELEKDEEDIS